MIIDIINKYKETNRVLNSHYSNKKKLVAILDFFKECERLNHFPPSKSFIEEFTPLLINIFKSSSINFIDPEYLNSAKIILAFARDTYKDNIIDNQIDTVLDYINMQLLKLYFYLGEFEEGLVILKRMVEGSEVKDEKTKFHDVSNSRETRNKKPAGNKHSLVSVDFFKKSRAVEILEEIKSELDRMNSFSKDEINVMLVEETGKDGNVEFGNLQTLHCIIQKSKKHGTDEDKFSFENITDIKDDELQTSLNIIERSLEKFLLKDNLRTTINKLIFKIGFSGLVNVYKGSSFLLPAAIISYCKYFEFTNNIVNYLVNSSAAFSGSLDNEGNLLKLPYESLKAKINAAFFSWIKYIVIPKNNSYEAEEILYELHKKYPNKKISVTGISNVSEIQNHPEIIKKEKDALYNHTKKFIKRNSLASGVTFSVIMLIAGFFIASNLIPKDIKPLPRPESEMHMIFAPDRDTSWIFHNENYFGEDTIDFGEVAIGDQWYPVIEFWNNSEIDESFLVSIEGEDKNEFELTWMYNSQQPDAPQIINNKIPSRLFVKFVPKTSEGNKSAQLLFSNKNKNSTKTIFLKGHTERLKNGYSLKIDDGNKDFVFDPKSNILQNEFTISFWMKPYGVLQENEPTVIFRDDNNPLSNNKLNIIVNKDYTLESWVYGSKSREIVTTKVKTKNKIIFDEWNYIAVTFKDGNYSLILNNEFVTRIIDKNAVRKINDCFYFNNIHPGNKGNSKPNKRDFKFLIDEFKIYNTLIAPETLIENSVKVGDENENLIVCFDFDDATPGQSYDKTVNDFTSDFYGGITRSLDAPTRESLKNYLFNKEKNKILKRSTNGIMRFNSSLFNETSSFTFQCDFKTDDYIDKESSVIPFFVNRANLDMGINLSKDSIELFSNNYFLKKDFNRVFIPFNNSISWNRFTIIYDMVINSLILYINGKQVANIIPIEKIVDITQNYMGIAFGYYNYFAGPRFFGETTYIDNIRIYNRAINPSEIFSDSGEGLLAYWTFEKSDEELVYDEVNNLPAILWGDCELVNEDIPYLK